MKASDHVYIVMSHNMGDDYEGGLNGRNMARSMLEMRNACNILARKPE
jgi:hypothetical protein